MDNNKIQNHQLSAKKYIEEHELEKIVSEMLNSVVYDKSKQPIIFMVNCSCLNFRLNTWLDYYQRRREKIII